MDLTPAALLSRQQLSPRTTRAVSLALTAAVANRDVHVDTDHLLLGLLDEGEGVGAFVVELLTGDIGRLRRDLASALPPGDAPTASDAGLDFTQQAMQSITCSEDVCRELGCSYVATEHLLLGILRDGQARGVALLNARGVTSESARALSLRILGAPPDSA